VADKKTIEDLLEDEIKDLYSAEKQLTKAIPRMAMGSNDPALQTAFRDHLKETEGQVKRLEEVAKLLDIKPTGKKCNGMEGVIEEGAEAIAEDGDETVLDLGIIGVSGRALSDRRLHDSDQSRATTEGGRGCEPVEGVFGRRAGCRCETAEDSLGASQIGSDRILNEPIWKNHSYLWPGFSPFDAGACMKRQGKAF
jgi:hypothetical protein